MSLFILEDELYVQIMEEGGRSGVDRLVKIGTCRGEMLGLILLCLSTTSTAE